MDNPSSDGQLINKTGRAVIAVCMLAFSIAIIWWLLLNGRSENSLHDSAMSWAWLLIIIQLVTLGVGGFASKAIDLANQKMRPPPQPIMGQQ